VTHPLQNCSQCFSALVFKMPHLYLPCCSLSPLFFFVCASFWKTDYSLPLCNSPSRVRRWSSLVRRGQDPSKNLPSFPEVYLISDPLEIPLIIVVLFCNISSGFAWFLLEIRQNTQLHISAVLNVVEGQFYVTSKYLLQLCALVFVFVTVCCKKHVM